MKYHQPEETGIEIDRNGNDTCENCGWVLSDDWMFCPSCGAYLKGDK